MPIAIWGSFMDLTWLSPHRVYISYKDCVMFIQAMYRWQIL